MVLIMTYSSAIKICVLSGTHHPYRNCLYIGNKRTQKSREKGIKKFLDRIASSQVRKNPITRVSCVETTESGNSVLI